jgi:hypothetical protein
VRRREAEQTLLAMRAHSPDCQYKQLRAWDRSGVCERCNAFVALNEINCAGFAPR